MLHRRLFLLVAFCLTALGLSQLAAQDETATLTPAPTETVIPTLAPTETATDIPSATPLPSETPTEIPSATPLPSETATPLPSETPTLLPTPTASETAVEPPTAVVEMSESPAPRLTVDSSLSSGASSTPTLTESPSATTSLTPTATSTANSDWKLLFTDNFDTGQLMLWKLGTGWGLVSNEAGQALQVTEGDAPTTFVYDTLGDASVQMRVLLTAGAARLSMRQSDAGAYSLLLDVNGQVSLLRGSNVIGSGTVSPTKGNTWRTIGVAVLGNNVTATVDGIVVITAQDATPLPAGTFSIAGINTGTLLMDDVSVSIPNNKLAGINQRLQLTATPSLSLPESSPTPNQAGLLSAQLVTCTIAPGTVLGNDYAIVAGGVSAADPGDVCGLKKAFEIAGNNTSIPVNIFLGTGTYALDETQVVFGMIRLYGRGVENSIITQISNTNVISGLMTINNIASVEVHNVTFRSGLATNTGAGAVTGGAIKMSNGTLKIFDSKFETNIANNIGGALNLKSGTVTIDRSIFLSNSVQVDWGGAITIANSAALSVNITCSRFETNNAITTGGAIFSENGQGLTISPNNSFTGNTSTSRRQIANGPTQINATNNWFAIAPVVPNDIDSTVNVAGLLPQDPTSGFSSTINDFYGTQNPFPCEMHRPEQALRDEINTYRNSTSMGLSIYYPGALGSPTSSARTGTIRNWTFDEMIQVLIGVQNTAAALGLAKNYPNAGTTLNSKQLFGTIMGNLDIIRVENDFTITNGDGCNGSNTVACTSNTSHFVAFYGNVSVNQQTMVHELGHRFNGRTILIPTYPDGQLKFYVTLTQTTSCFYRDPNNNSIKHDNQVCILDNTGLQGLVMGPFTTGWSRGARGWGSGPSNVISVFQKHPPDAFPSEVNDLSKQFEETASDLFLNWVYRKRLNTEDQGFKNISWTKDDPYFPNQNCYQALGCNDNRNPGDARFNWTDIRIGLIFTSRGW